MSILGLLCTLFALIAALVLVLYGLQRRDMRALRDLAQQLQRVAIGGRLPARLEIDSDKPEMTAFATAINHLLTRTAVADSEAVDAPRLFADLGRPHPRGGVGPPRGHPVRQPPVRQLHRRRSRRARRPAPRGPGAARVCRAGERQHPEAPRRRVGRGALRGRHDRPAGPDEPPRDRLDGGELRQGQRAADHRRRDHSHADGARADGRRRRRRR